jgi:undecaprenyl-diphosphatase
MGYGDAIILGVIEGITEFLPISSTGHLILAAQFLNLPSSNFLKSFEVVIQAGAIMAVITLYGRLLWSDRRLLRRVIAAFTPTATFGLLLYPFVRSWLGNPEIVLWAMGLGGLALIVFEKYYTEPSDASEDLSLLSYWKVVTIGLFQVVAMIPGVSRSATTIVSGLMLGMSRRAIVEFSFLLAIPTIGAATALDLYKNIGSFSSAHLGFLGLGFLAAWVSALLVIRWLLAYVRTHDFTFFGVYRIVAALIFWYLLH